MSRQRPVHGVADCARPPAVTAARCVHAVTHGAYLRDVTDPTLVERCRALGLVVPGDVTFSHLTAAELLGMPGWGRADCVSTDWWRRGTTACVTWMSTGPR